MSIYSEIKKILRENSIILKKTYGQNFLIKEEVYKKIVEVAEINSQDYILEVGAGLGILSKLLAEKALKVFAVEVDKDLVNLLRERIGDLKNIEIINNDILKLDLRQLEFKDKIKVVGNIPYYITTPIIFKFLKEKESISDMTLMVQKEVGERIVAKAGDKRYGALAIMVQYQAEVKKSMIVKNFSFFPKPKVDSVILKISLKPTPKFKLENEAFFLRVVKALFSKRRKMIINSLRSYLPDLAPDLIREELSNQNIDYKLRAEDLEIEEIVKLSNSLYNCRLGR
jgi:16S rRNA (adenine1518-N6/adenine1519-N6)-dimethyltransferase